jgi:hypothetical protein
VRAEYLRAAGSRSGVTGLDEPTPPRAVPTARSAGAGTVVCSTVHSRLAHRLRACEGPVRSEGYLGDEAAESALCASIAKSAQSVSL